MRGRKNSDKPQGNSSLPPCRVCGEPGSGFHYGVTTCGACKGFFRRSLVRKEPYVCIQSHLCHVGPSTSRRQSCPKCRYDKCVSVGMSKEACKVGRYSLMKKSKDMIEVMEYQVSLETDDFQQNNTKRRTRPDGTENQNPQIASHFETSINEPFTELPNGFGILNEFDLTETTHETVFSNDDNMPWDFEEQRVATQYRHVDGYSSGHDSDDSYTVHEDNRMDNVFDRSLSMGSCFLEIGGARSNLLAQNVDVKPLAGGDNSITEPSYTVLETPPLIKTNTPWFDLTNSMSYGKNSSFGIGSVTDLTPSSLDTVSSFTNTSHPYTPQYGHMSHSTSYLKEQLITHQQPWTLTPLHSTHQNKYSTIQNNNQNIALINDAPREWSFNQLLAQSMNTDNLLEHPDSFRYNDIFKTHSNRMDVSVETSGESRHRPQSVTESTGPPIVSTSHSLEVTFNPNLNSLDIIRASSNKRLTDPAAIAVNQPRTSKRELEDANEDEPNRKRLCSERLEQNSSMHLVPAKNNSVSRVLDPSDNPSSTFIIYSSPSFSQYTLSIYERFPFICYEKETLGALLKSCYEVSDMIDYHRPKPLKDSDGILYPAIPDAGDYKSLVNVLASAPSPDIQFCSNMITQDSNEMDELYNNLMAAQIRFIGGKEDQLSESDMQSAQEMFWAMCQFKKRLHGQMNFIDDEKYFTILDATGVDIDHRKEWTSLYLGAADDSLVKVIKFFRAVPGFTDFTLADRITLSKACIFKYKLLTSHRGMDTTKSILIDEESMSACNYEIVRRLFPKTASSQDQLNKYCEILKALKLSFEEIVALKAVVLTESNAELEQPDVVRQCHKTYLQCFLNLERNLHGSTGDDRFAQIIRAIDRLTGMRRPAEMFSQQMKLGIQRLLDEKQLQLFRETILNQRPLQIKTAEPESAIETNNDNSADLTLTLF